MEGSAKNQKINHGPALLADFLCALPAKEELHDAALKLLHSGDDRLDKEIAQEVSRVDYHYRRPHEEVFTEHGTKPTVAGNKDTTPVTAPSLYEASTRLVTMLHQADAISFLRFPSDNAERDEILYKAHINADPVKPLPQNLT